MAKPADIRLCASLVCRNELSRYLPLVLENLLGFCDQIVIVDDGSDDGTREFLVEHDDPRISVFLNPRPTFFEHEGQTRQRLLVETLAHEPTHVLNVDCDELVSDGHELRRLLSDQPNVDVWGLSIEEVWGTTENRLLIREDGGWRSHPLNVLWRVPSAINDLKIMDRRLACRRVPTTVWQQPARATGVSLLHFGWANKHERAARYARYQQHDRGRFHASSHLRSIMAPDHRVKLRARDWPEGPEFDAVRGQLLGRVGSAT